MKSTGYKTAAVNLERFGPPRAYRLRWPCAWCRIFFFVDPRATPEARLALGAAFLRAVRFSFLRSVFSVTVFVFICSSFLQTRVTLHQFLEAVAGKQNRQLRVRSVALPTDYRTGAVLGVLYYCTLPRA